MSSDAGFKIVQWTSNTSQDRQYIECIDIRFEVLILQF
jgi:hypothetical protein